MPNELNSINRRLFWTGTVFGAALLAAAAWSVSRVVTQHASIKQWVAHTREVIGVLDELLLQVQTAETGQRGYLLTGRESYLHPYESATSRIGPLLNRLAELTRDNPHQQQRIHRLRNACELKLNELKETVRLRRERGFGAAGDVVLTDRGREAMSQITAVLDEMLFEEDQLLKLRTDNSATVTRLLYQITAGLFVVTLLLLVVLLRLIRRVNKLQAGLVSVCAWTKHVRFNGDWVPVDVYLTERFGLNITHGISKKAADALMAENDLASESKGKASSA